MGPRTENKIVLVVRRTRLAELIARFNTAAQARFYVEHLGADFSDYEREDARYRAAVAETERVLGELGRVQVVERRFLPNFLFGPRDTVVVIGQDGLVANTLKYLDAQPVVGVNPDPERWDGALLPFRVGDLGSIVPETFARRRPLRSVSMAKAELNTGQRLYAVNDLFIGVRSHGSARYAIASAGRQEQHSSSGIIVSTGLGSTGWFRSLITGATAIAGQFTGADVTPPGDTGFAWDADYLYFTVREPFPSRTSRATLVFGKITRDQPLQLTSQMPEEGVIFSDGVQQDFLEFGSGTLATITLAEKAGLLVT